MIKWKILFSIAILFCCGTLFESYAQTPAKEPPAPTDQEIEAERQKYRDMLLRKREEIQRELDAIDGKALPTEPQMTAGQVGNPEEPPVPNTGKPGANVISVGDDQKSSNGGAMPATTVPTAIAPCQAYALDDKDHQVEAAACDIAQLIVYKKRDYRIGNLYKRIQGDLETIFRIKLLKRVEENDLVAASERIRTDKQVGAGASAAGTTSLVVRGGGPAIFGWAVENGAATSSVDGTTVTVRVNPYNAAQALLFSRSLPEIRSFTSNSIGRAFSEGGRSGDRRRFFDVKKLYFGFTFDTTRGRETPQFVISKQQLSAWSVRYEFINHRNPLAPEWDRRREKYFKDQEIPGDAVVKATKELFDLDNVKTAVKKVFLEIDDALKAKDDSCAKDLEGAQNLIARNQCIQNAYAIFMSKVDSFPLADFEKQKPITDLFKTIDDNTAVYKKNREDFVAEVNKGAIATLEYTNHREVNAPDWSNVRFIWEKGLLDGFNFTANAEMSFYNKKPTIVGVRRIKDFDLAIDLERKLNDILPFGSSTFSGAFRYVRQQGDVVLPNGIVASGTRGDIAFGQLKLTIPVGNSGLKFPFTVTFGNRSEFLKEHFVRGNFGFTFDLDQLFKGMNIAR